MDRLIPLIRTYQQAPDVDRRLALAEDILGRIGPRLRAFLVGSVPRDAMEDIHQKAMIGIATRLLTFTGDSDSLFWSWCCRIAQNKVTDYIRAKRSRPLDHLSEVDVWQIIERTQEERLIAEVERQELQEAMELVRQSKPACYRRLWDHYITGLTFEIAILAKKCAGTNQENATEDERSEPIKKAAVPKRSIRAISIRGRRAQSQPLNRACYLSASILFKAKGERVSRAYEVSPDK